MKSTPIDPQIVNDKIRESGIRNLRTVSIRQLVRLVSTIEEATGEKFIRMEMGIPGLDPVPIGVNAEIEALKTGVASKYPPIEGIPPLKKEVSRFLKLFMDIEVSPESCVPVVGSMMGGMAAFLMANRVDKKKNTTLFIDPGFPVQKQQLQVLDFPYETFDIYDYRGEKLKEKLLEYVSRKNVSCFIYSNPNNPSWICFTEQELAIIGAVANEHDIIVIEDLAYFGMDFRHDYSQPGKPPFQPTVAKYTNNYMLLLSSSKAFSYAGERIGALIMSDHLFERKYSNLLHFYPSDMFGHAAIYGGIYALCAGTSHAAQYALTAMLSAANDGKYNFLNEVKRYGERAKNMKKIFVENGFQIVYDKDGDEPIADGFYFTISYPGITGEQLLKELLYYGISAISLIITGSERSEGLRACVSLVHEDQIPVLEKRIMEFHKNHLQQSNA
jgi:aspartate/methionine/tyrosine aminotransferase